MGTYGPAYDEVRDGLRVSDQMAAIRTYISADCAWYTLEEIEHALGYPQASISAQLRHLRKARFGAHRIEKRNVGGGLWQYRIHDDHLFFDGLCDCGAYKQVSGGEQLAMDLLPATGTQSHGGAA